MTIASKDSIIAGLRFLDYCDEYCPILVGISIPLFFGSHGVYDLILGLFVVQLDFPHLIDGRVAE